MHKFQRHQVGFSICNFFYETQIFVKLINAVNMRMNGRQSPPHVFAKVRDVFKSIQMESRGPGQKILFRLCPPTHILYAPTFIVMAILLCAVHCFASLDY